MKNTISGASVYDTTIRLIILLLIITCSLLIMAPFANIVLWSAILAIAFHSFHKGLSEKMGGKPKWASAIIVISILTVFIIPMGLVVSSLAEDVHQIKASHDAGTLTIPAPDKSVKDWPIIGEKLYENWQDFSSDPKEFVGKHQNKFREVTAAIVKGILGAIGGVLQMAISLIFAGVLLAIEGPGEGVRKFFRKVGGDRGDEFVDLTVKTITSVVKGILGEGFILALLHGVVFIGICTCHYANPCFRNNNPCNDILFLSKRGTSSHLMVGITFDGYPFR